MFMKQILRTETIQYLYLMRICRNGKCSDKENHILLLECPVNTNTFSVSVSFLISFSENDSFFDLKMDNQFLEPFLHFRKVIVHVFY